MNPSSYTGNARALTRVDFRDQVKDFRIPILFVVGEKDPVISAEDAQRTAEYLGGKIMVLEGIGHSLVVEDPKKFKEILIGHDIE